MLNFKNSLDDVLKKLEKELDYSESSLAAWEAVIIKNKKDGSEYVNVKKALSGASLYDYIGHKNGKMIVTFKTAFSGYETDEIYVYGYLDELPDDDERKKDYVKSFIRQAYTFTADEMRQAIKKHIAYKHRRIANLKKFIEVAPDVYREFHEAISVANGILSDKAEIHEDGQYPDCSLRYLLEEKW